MYLFDAIMYLFDAILYLIGAILYPVESSKQKPSVERAFPCIPCFPLVCADRWP